MSKSFKEDQKRSPDTSQRPQKQPKRTPESFQGQRCNKRNPEKVSRERPGTPKAPQRPNKQFLTLGKTSLGALWRPPWGSSGIAQIVLFDMNRLHWPPKSSIEKQKFFNRFLMKTCKNRCFFNAKPLSTPARRHPQEI